MQLFDFGLFGASFAIVALFFLRQSVATVWQKAFSLLFFVRRASFAFCCVLIFLNVVWKMELEK